MKMSHLLSTDGRAARRTVGNALEVAECVEILQGGGPPDLRKLILDLAEKVSATPREQLGTAAERWNGLEEICRSWSTRRMATPRRWNNHRRINRAPIVQPDSGNIKMATVKKMDAEFDRARFVSCWVPGDNEPMTQFDFAVGISGIKKIGEQVKARRTTDVCARANRAITRIRAAASGKQPMLLN